MEATFTFIERSVLLWPGHNLRGWNLGNFAWDRCHIPWNRVWSKISMIASCNYTIKFKVPAFQGHTKRHGTSAISSILGSESVKKTSKARTLCRSLWLSGRFKAPFGNRKRMEIHGLSWASQSPTKNPWQNTSKYPHNKKTSKKNSIVY